MLQAVTVPAGADDLDNRRSDTQSQLDAARAQQAELSASLEGLEGQVAATGQQLVELQGQLPAAQAAVTTATAEAVRTRREAELTTARLSGAQQQQAELTTTIETDSAQAAQIRAAVVRMARSADQGGSDLAELTVLLGSASTEDFMSGYAQTTTALDVQTRTLNQLDGLNAGNQSANNRLTAVESKISDLKAAADQAAADATAAQEAAEAAQAALEELTAQVTAQQESLEGQAADVEVQLAAADASAAQLSSDLAAIIAAQQARPTPPAAAPAPPPSTASGAAFANPTVHRPMVVTSEYGMRLQPVLKIYRLHAGTDLRSRCNEPVYAARGGTVQWAKYRSGYGNQVMVDHGWVNGKSLMSSYSHLNRTAVGSGQRVEAGQLVGYAGATGGVSTACHLHFEVYVGGSTVNPRPYLGL
jgi:murein DD-endopeptidase MepM/ murein hydrolase activator NlpD